MNSILEILSFRNLIAIIASAYCGLLTPAFADPNDLRVEPSISEVAPSFRSDSETSPGQVTILESSRDSIDWYPIFASDDPNWNHTESNDLIHKTHFYRTRAATPDAIPADPSWKASISVPDDTFFSKEFEDEFRLLPISTRAKFIKFAIMMNDPTKVYFQDSSLYRFHFEFAKDKLPPFSSFSSTEFNNATLYRDEQQAVLGAVIVDNDTNEYGIQFSGSDRYPAEMTRFLIELINASIVNDSSIPGYYMPTWEQWPIAEENRAYFAEHGITVDEANRWEEPVACYSPGWALGRLRYIETSDIQDAYEEGRLLPSDILLTDAIPAELPFVSGILSLSPATPNSHVAILAQSYDIPFAYLSEQAFISDMLEKLDTEILLSIETDCSLRIDPTETFASEFKERLLQLKKAPELEIEAKETYGAISENVSGLLPSDIKYFGGKASNFGFLLREIPDNTRPMAIAFSFDLWDAYLNQEIDPGKSLKQYINEKLAHYTWPVADLPALFADLKIIRDRIEDEANFTEQEKIQIFAALEDFDLNRKIRFRSSTNVEDSEFFSGAGLYESKSGCLADEFDTDADGPSLCDPSKEDEKGVFRAIRKVYSSFYNENAFLERLRFNIDEEQVGMAILAHYSYPDEIEMANGVIKAEIGALSLSIEIVSQPGAASVTNPDIGAQPEVVSTLSYDRDSIDGLFTKTQSSGFLVLGDDYVLDYPNEYQELAVHVLKIVEAIEANDASKRNYTLDFEYKKVDPGILELKQVRETPSQQRDDQNPILIGGRFDVQSGASASFGSGIDGILIPDQMGGHYLKSKMTVEIQSHFIDDKTPKPIFMKILNWQRQNDGAIMKTNVNVLGDSTASYEYEEDPARYEGTAIFDWTESSANGDLQYSLHLDLSHLTLGRISTPFVFANKRPFYLKLTTSQPRFLGINYFVGNEPFYHDQMEVPLAQPRALTINEDELLLQRRSTPEELPIQIDSFFYWPPFPTHFTVGYTASLVKWSETKISNLTSEPMILTGDFSQTYAPEHHNFTEYLIFEPRLDPNVSEAQLAELEAKDIMIIHFRTNPNDNSQSEVHFVGFDGQVRTAE